MKMKSIIALSIASFALLGCQQDQPEVQQASQASAPEPVIQQASDLPAPKIVEPEVVKVSPPKKNPQWQLGTDEHELQFNVLASKDGKAKLLLSCGKKVETPDGKTQILMKFFLDDTKYHKGETDISTAALLIDGNVIPITELYSDEFEAYFPVWSFKEIDFFDEHTPSQEDYNSTMQDKYANFAGTVVWTELGGKKYNFTFPKAYPKCVPGDDVNGFEWVANEILSI